MEIVVAKRGEIESGKAKLCKVNEEEVAVFNKDGEYYAIANMCPHRGGPLGEGEIDNKGIVTCPWHGWSFELKTGKCTMMPSQVKTYEVVIDGDEIRISVQ